jgi:hypothetical protein
MVCGETSGTIPALSTRSDLFHWLIGGHHYHYMWQTDLLLDTGKLEKRNSNKQLDGNCTLDESQDYLVKLNRNIMKDRLGDQRMIVG